MGNKCPNLPQMKKMSEITFVESITAPLAEGDEQA